MATAIDCLYNEPMDLETILLFALGAAAVLIILRWRRIDAFTFGTNYHCPSPLEPCWTEEIGHDGRYSYGRACCVDDDLMDVDARAARGVYQMPHPY
jgi:hypothetical protein